MAGRRLELVSGEQSADVQSLRQSQVEDADDIIICERDAGRLEDDLVQAVAVECIQVFPQLAGNTKNKFQWEAIPFPCQVR